MTPLTTLAQASLHRLIGQADEHGKRVVLLDTEH